MPDTIATVVANVQRRLPDLSTTRAIDLANIVNQELYTQIPEIRRTTASVNLVAGTREYDLAEQTMQIELALYYTGAGAATKLSETNVETLNKINQAWRAAANGVPTQFYLSTDTTGLTIGFDVPPATTTSGGYPIVTLYGSIRPTTFTSYGSYTSDTVPQVLFNSQLYVEGIAYYASLELRPSAAQAFKATYAEQVKLNADFIRTRNEGLKQPPFSNIRGD